MEKNDSSNTSSFADFDQDRPIVLVTSLGALKNAGVDLRSLQPAGAEISLDVDGLHASRVFLHSVPRDCEEHGELLGAEEMASRMGCSARAVYQQEQSGNLFSILPPGRTKGRKFPRFQLNPRLRRSALRRLIEVFREHESLGVTSNDMWNLLLRVQPSLEGATLLDVLTRRTNREWGYSELEDVLIELAKEEISLISS